MLKSRTRNLILASLSIVITLGLLWYRRPEPPLPPGSTVAKIIVYKSKNIMEVYSRDELLKTYKITDDEIDELYEKVAIGTPIRILP